MMDKMSSRDRDRDRDRFPLYPASVSETDGMLFYLARMENSGQKFLVVEGPADDFQGVRQDDLLFCPLSPQNAKSLREHLSWLNPVPLGLNTSVGFGDRLGLATPGHIHALRGTGLAPIFAQQSVRENARTGRSPQDVIDDATWGLFQEGWRAGCGADADHLKTTDDARAAVETGYTFFTVDPGEHVDNGAHSASSAELSRKVDELPWDILDSSPSDLETRLLNIDIDLETRRLRFGRESLLRAAAKYGPAVAHAVRMSRAIDKLSGSTPWELEVSVDETATPTSHLEHYYIATELRRLGIAWISLAPRYVGRFEKGVDYIGDLDTFRTDFSVHAELARTLGPYKLSLHSGSDKFGIYPIAVELAGSLVHLKTAGTSYLEALRAIAEVKPDLFRKIYALAFDRYADERATNHVSAEPSRAPDPVETRDADLPDVVGQFDAREMLHVTYGSALARFQDQIDRVLGDHEEAHYRAISSHFDRHLAPFAKTSS